MNANQIQSEFISLLRQNGEKQDFCCQLWSRGKRRMSRNIIELSGSINCLIYFVVEITLSGESRHFQPFGNKAEGLFIF